MTPEQRQEELDSDWFAWPDDPILWISPCGKFEAEIIPPVEVTRHQSRKVRPMNFCRVLDQAPALELQLRIIRIPNRLGDGYMPLPIVDGKVHVSLDDLGWPTIPDILTVDGQSWVRLAE